jgi:glycosyltransferase involved in cell wall biosynthesis
MLALEPPQVRVHHQPSFVKSPVFRPGTRAFNNRYFSQKNPFRVIWPHRLDKEKRPDALIRIARMLREQHLPVEINVYGQQVLSHGGESLLRSLKDEGIVYHGPYSGGLASLPTHEYHALLLTSESEGLPLVLVQSMLLGVPVVATAVGGVIDLVHHDETGFLVSDPDNAEGFVDAIRVLLESLEGRRRVIRHAYDFALAQHDWATLTPLAEDLFSNPTR